MPDDSQQARYKKNWQVHEIMTWTLTCLALPRRIERVGICDSKTRGRDKYSCSKVMVNVSTDSYVADDWRCTGGVHCSKIRKNWSKFTYGVNKPSLVFIAVINILYYPLFIKKYVRTWKWKVWYCIRPFVEVLCFDKWHLIDTFNPYPANVENMVS